MLIYICVVGYVLSSNKEALIQKFIARAGKLNVLG